MLAPGLPEVSWWTAFNADGVRANAREGLVVTLTGVDIGLVATLGLSRVMAGYVYGIKPTDPLTFAAAAVVLVLVALVACYVPARRAASIEPMRVLRSE